jgi:Protein of unknown function (DUF3142)
MIFARAKLPLLLLMTALAVLSGGSPTHRHLPSDAYIWQRRWTPAVAAALEQAAGQIRAWRVLVAEADVHGNWSLASVDWAALKRSKRPVIFVVRIDGQLARLNDSSMVDGLAGMIAGWRRSDVPVAGLEIDHDCATARLAAYARFLSALRARLDRAVPLSITGLPAWLSSPEVDEVFAPADEIDLQVHAVQNPRMGLFDRQRARAWIAELSHRTRKPFRVALPAYGSRVTWREDGSILTVESEMPLLAGGDSALELMASPQEVAALVRELQDDSPANLVGIAWFRLPTNGDRRAWSIETWRAVVLGRPLQARVEATIRPSDTPGMNILVLSNPGDIDADLPRRVELPDSCTIGDGANGYTPIAGAARLTLRRQQSGLLHSHHQQVIGWMRCAPAQSEIHVRS